MYSATQLTEDGQAVVREHSLQTTVVFLFLIPQTAQTFRMAHLHFISHQSIMAVVHQKLIQRQLQFLLHQSQMPDSTKVFVWIKEARF